MYKEIELKRSFFLNPLPIFSDTLGALHFINASYTFITVLGMYHIPISETLCFFPPTTIFIRFNFHRYNSSSYARL